MLRFSKKSQKTLVEICKVYILFFSKKSDSWHEKEILKLILSDCKKLFGGKLV